MHSSLYVRGGSGIDRSVGGGGVVNVLLVAVVVSFYGSERRLGSAMPSAGNAPRWLPQLVACGAHFHFAATKLSSCESALQGTTPPPPGSGQSLHQHWQQVVLANRQSYLAFYLRQSQTDWWLIGIRRAEDRRTASFLFFSKSFVNRKLLKMLSHRKGATICCISIIHSGKRASAAAQNELFIYFFILVYCSS